MINLIGNTADFFGKQSQACVCTPHILCHFLPEVCKSALGLPAHGDLTASEHGSAKLIRSSQNVASTVFLGFSQRTMIVPKHRARVQAFELAGPASLRKYIRIGQQ